MTTRLLSYPPHHRFERTRVLLLVQRRRPGYTWHPPSQRYRCGGAEEEGGSCYDQQQTPGSGHCLLQMGYPGEALVVGEDGLARAMLGTTFEAMTDWGVE